MNGAASARAARTVPAWAIAVAFGILSVGAAAFVRAHAAPAPASFFLSDQRFYHAMAEAPFSDAPDVHHGLYGRRVLVPLVAGLVGRFVGDVTRGFLVLTFASFALLPAAALWWCGALGTSRVSRIAAAALMALAPAVVGMLAWDVERIDAPVLLLIFAAAVFTVRHRPWLMLSAILLLSAAKETALLSVLFAIAWSLLVDRRLRPYAAGAVGVFVVVRLLLLPALVPVAPQYAFDNLVGVKGVLASLSVRYVARRVLLSTAATWNVMLIAIAIVAARGRERRAVAVLCGLLIATAQILGISDNERVVAAGYPFALGLCAFALDGIAAERRRAWAATVLIAAQLPWLAVYGRVIMLAWLRDVEIGIFCGAMLVFAVALARASTRGRRGVVRPAPTGRRG